MRLLKLFPLFLILPGTVFSQVSDSLRTQLELLTDKQPVNVETVNDLWQIYAGEEPDAAIHDGRRWLDEGTHSANIWKVAVSMNLIAAGHFYKNEYRLADSLFEQALKFCHSNDLQILLAPTYRGAAVSQRYQDKFVSSLTFYLKALQAAEGVRDSTQLMKSLSGLSGVYLVLGDLDQALVYGVRSYQLGQMLKVSVYSTSVAANYVGDTYMEKGMYDSAQKYLEIAVENAAKTNTLYAKIVTLNNLGTNYLRQNNLSRAELYIQQAYDYAEEFNNVGPLATVMVAMSGLRLNQKRIRESISFAQNAISYSRKFGGQKEILEAYMILTKAFALQGDHTSSFNYWQKAYNLNDSIKGGTVTGAVAEAAKQYELSLKESTINDLTREAERTDAELLRRRNLTYFLTIVTVLVMIIAGFAWYNYKVKAKLNTELKKRFNVIKEQKAIIETINLGLQEKAFRAQIKPHFIFNCLNSIQYLIANADNDEAFAYLTKFSMLLRKILEYSDLDKITLGEEIELLQLYLALESLRFEDDFKYELICEADVDENVTVPPLLIQPFVENAIVHGLLRKKGERLLKVDFSNENGHVLCRIKDNGIGREAARKNKRGFFYENKSRGVDLSANRLTVHNHKVDQSGIMIDDLIDDLGNPSGTLVTIKIARHS